MASSATFLRRAAFHAGPLATRALAGRHRHCFPLPCPSPPEPVRWKRSLPFFVQEPFLGQSSRPFSSKRNDGGNREDGNDVGSWKFTPDDGLNGEDLFKKRDGDGDGAGGLSGLDGPAGGDVAGGRDSWQQGALAPEGIKGDIFQEIDQQLQPKKNATSGGGDDEWATAKGYKPWGFGEDEDKGEDFLFVEEQGGLEGLGGDGEMADAENMKAEQIEQLEKEEKVLLGKLKGPNRAFGDLIAASGIKEEMIDSLILLKDLKGVQGLPPLREIEDMRLEKDDAPSVRYEMERKKQEEVAKARVRQVDEKGRAYGTGRRKCSIARIWIQPGDGKFVVNDKQFDTYFPIIDHRADLLRPFTATKTLGLFDVNCTVKGGGVSGQVGAVRLGISNALQNFEPGLRENLRSAGFLTRDARVVERKKPGKAKARKSFQWVKR
ncbi:hypothetical protein Taro_020611 [Colocasia esculenta]|uniref:30S ribosomal protein S9, chloroplastic n=1 Tax=Colocasia esculenta TaxID=4460 RepID=A0A843UP47_COLES|nr:hypothetical protein [Colocasia esculenta]